jgi:hypothetical protein
MCSTAQQLRVERACANVLPLEVEHGSGARAYVDSRPQRLPGTRSCHDLVGTQWCLLRERFKFDAREY